MTLRRTALAALAADQVSKWAVEHFMVLGQSVAVLKPFFYLTSVRNPGAAFGILASSQAFWRVPFFILLTALAGLAVYAYQRFVPPEKKLVRTALGLIFGGALGNFMDRQFQGQVVDFIDWGVGRWRWPVFNLADSCITIGIVLLLWDAWRGSRVNPDKTA